MGYRTEYNTIKKSGLFDARYYLQRNPDVRRADIDPLMHYIKFGWKENRNPGPFFDTRYYVESNPDVRQKNINPLVHYILFGKKEGRSPIEGGLINEDQASIDRTGQNNPLIARNTSQYSRGKPIYGLRLRLRNRWNYLRINGFKKFVTKVADKIANSASKATRRLQAYNKVSEHDPYLITYKERLAASNGSDKNDYINFTENKPTLKTSDIKLIAFYLPQFHPIPENDAWWGRGFTEWTNVSKAVPQFVGHYQPHLPGELGFYDLRVPEVQRQQVALAKNYGIYGFCFYYYWFNGKRLLDYPLERFVHDPEIDFPFCICWANENWTRRWDGYESDVLIRQVHSPETDLRFIQDIMPLLKHKNYICIDGHPIIIIYRVELLPDPQRTAKLWKEICLFSGIEEPYIIAAQTFGFTDPRKVGFDAAVEFPPHNIVAKIITDQVQLLNPKYSGLVFQYSGDSSLIELYLELDHSGYTAFKTVCPGWDNDPRKPGRGFTYAFSTPEKYKNWLKVACDLAKNNPSADEKIVFINAWNEWGEGAYLEPDRKYGYAYLQATYDALKQSLKTDYPSNLRWTILFVLHDAHFAGAQQIIKNVISWLHDHTLIKIKMLFLSKGDMFPQYTVLGDTLVLEEANLLSINEFNDTILNFCEGKPDLIYGNTVVVGKIYDHIQKIGSPIITHIHELELSINRYASSWIEILCKNTDHFIAASGAVATNLKTNHEVNPDVISTIYEGIVATEYNLNVQDKLAIKQKLGIQTGKKIVVGCGRGMPFRKGADLFIQVANRIKQELPDQIQFLWIGDFDPSEHDEKLGYWKNYQEIVSKGNDIKFLGFQSSPKDYMLIADLFLLTSREDPFPLVMLEAAQCSLPIVCFENSGGASEFIKDEAGRVVPFGDVEKMADASVQLLLNDQLRISLGDKARQKVEQSFTIDSIAPQILSVCRKVAKKKPIVSVIVPNYNHAKYLHERLDSIINQTLRDFEVIILDDASTDNSLEIIQNYSDRADIKVVRNPSNSGSPFHQWITGFEMAQSDLIWIAESDDKCDNNFLQALLPAFMDPEVKLAYSNSWIINSNSNVIGDYLSTNYLKDLSETKWKTSYKTAAEEEINDGLGIKNTILNISSAVFRKPKLDRTFYEALGSMRFTGDWFFIVQLIHNGYIYYEAQKYNYHRRYDESVIGELLKNNKVEQFYKEMAAVQKLICDLYKFDSAFLNKWIAYHHQQWNDFFPTKDFTEFNKVYPYQEMIEVIKSKSTLQHR